VTSQCYSTESLPYERRCFRSFEEVKNVRKVLKLVIFHGSAADRSYIQGAHQFYVARGSTAIRCCLPMDHGQNLFVKVG
jgi:hypothetical protein